MSFFRNSILTALVVLSSCSSGPDPFRVITASPSNGATNVDVYEAQNIEIRFSLDLDPDSLFTLNETEQQVSVFQLFPTGSPDQPVEGIVEVSGRSLLFLANLPLEFDTSYTINISRDILSTRGNQPRLRRNYSSTFRTSEMPIPVLTGISHIGVEANSVEPIVLSFNFGPTDSPEFLRDVIQVRNNTSGDLVTGDIGVSELERTITFYPIDPATGQDSFLPYNSSFSVSFAGNINGNSGRETVVLTPDVVGVRNFATPGPQIVNFTPTGNDVHPSPLAVDNNRVVQVDVDFNFNINSFSLNSSTVNLREANSGVEVPVEILSSNSGITLVSFLPLNYDTEYIVTVTTGVSSPFGANIRLPSDFSWRFRTQELRITMETLAFSSDVLGPGDEVILETNFDLDSSSSLEIRGIDVNGNPTVLRGELVQIIPNVQEQFFSRRLVISSAQTRELGYNQPVTVERNLVSFLTLEQLNVSPTVLTVQVEAKRIVPSNPQPRRNEQFVDADVNIRFNLDTNIEVIGTNQRLIIENNPDRFIRVTDCFNDRVPGDVFIESGSPNRVTFVPFFFYESLCEYEVQIVGNVELTDSGIETEEYSWFFETDGLEVNSVSPGSFVVSSPFQTFEVEFDADIESVDPDGIYFQSANGGILSAIVSINFFGHVEVSPVLGFQPDTSYSLVIEEGSVLSDENFSLAFDFFFDFVTEDFEVFLIGSSNNRRSILSAKSSTESAKTSVDPKSVPERARYSKKRGKEKKSIERRKNVSAKAQLSGQ